MLYFDQLPLLSYIQIDDYGVWLDNRAVCFGMFMTPHHDFAPADEIAVVTFKRIEDIESSDGLRMMFRLWKPVLLVDDRKESQCCGESFPFFPRHGMSFLKVTLDPLLSDGHFTWATNQYAMNGLIEKEVLELDRDLRSHTTLRLMRKRLPQSRELLSNS